MILTCPECATRYFVPDDSVSPAGRTVRCANCGSSWRAEPEAPLDLVPESAAVEEDEAPPTEAPLKGDDLPRVFRERIVARRQALKALTSGAVWAAVGLGALALLTALILGRNSVARAWPNMASAYAAVGLPVNVVGLEILDQKAQEGFEEGQPAVLITGKLRNITDRTVTAPPLRVTLFNAADQLVGTRILRITNPEVPARGERSFAVRVIEPPASVAEGAVELGFELGEIPAGEGLRERTHAASVEGGGLRPAADHAPGRGDAH